MSQIVAVLQRWKGAWAVRVYLLSGGRRRLTALVAGDLRFARRAIALAFLFLQGGGELNEGVLKGGVLSNHGERGRLPQRSAHSTKNVVVKADARFRRRSKNA